MKQKLIIISILILGLIGGGGGAVYALYDNCGFGKCFEKTPPLRQGELKPNYSMIIHLPLYGNTDNSWVTILSYDNFTALKQNIASMAVLDIHTTTESPNTNYCPLAVFIYAKQSDDFKQKYINYTRFMIPEYCDKEIGFTPIPEFNTSASIILLVSIISILVIVRIKWNK